MTGSYRLLSASPLWLTFAVLYFLCIGVLHIGRWVFEGRAYNTSFTSEYGDVALITVVLIGMTVMKNQPMVSGVWGVLDFQVTLAGMCLIAGLASNYYLNAKEVMDIYHNMFVLPLLAYLILSTVPIVFKYGTTRDKKAVVAFIVIWAAFGLYDIATGRLDQRTWLHNHGGWPQK
jgi:hypothetical protein